MTGDVGRGCGDASRALLFLFGIIIKFRSNSLSRPYFSPYKHGPAELTQNAFIEQALIIPRKLEGITGRSKCLFPSVRSWHRPIGDNTLNSTLRRLGYDKTELTVHGLRPTASALLNESGQWHADAIERQLAHQQANEVQGSHTHAAEFWARAGADGALCSLPMIRAKAFDILRPIAKKRDLIYGDRDLASATHNVSAAGEHDRAAPTKSTPTEFAAGPPATRAW